MKTFAREIDARCNSCDETVVKELKEDAVIDLETKVTKESVRAAAGRSEVRTVREVYTAGKYLRVVCTYTHSEAACVMLHRC